jgi:uncharacterized protein with von Willebrand factor type A (vWA) domain
VPAFLDNLVVFGRMLRSAGLPVGTDRLITLTDALSLVDLGSKEEVKAACRAVLIQRHEDLAAFEDIFDEFFSEASASAFAGVSSGQLRRDRLPTAADHGLSGRSSPDNSRAESDVTVTELPLGAWSDIETVANKDFAELTGAEQAIARAALARLTFNMEERRTRRWVAGRGSRIDLRRALARSLRTGGEITALPRRRRRTRRRPIVLLCDVSGSMERYSRMLLHFAHSLMSRHQRVEAFLFSTQLTRITRQLGVRRPDAALAAVSRSVHDWSGGTRIGCAVKEFHQRWGRRVLNGGPVVLLISDGWDRGDPEVLRAQIARLQRSCHRLVWLNPLIGTTDYAPLTRGLQAALPYVDDFLPLRTLTDLADLARHLNTLAVPRSG